MQRFAEAVALQERGAAQAPGDGGVDPIPEDPVARKQKQFHQAKLAMRRLRAQAGFLISTIESCRVTVCCFGSAVSN